MKFFNKLLVGSVIAVAAFSAYSAPIDFTAVTGAVDATTVVTAIVAMGAIMILPSVAKWAVKKVATFFG